MSDRAKYITIGVTNGIIDIKRIRDAYNDYIEEGAEIPSPKEHNTFEDGGSTHPNQLALERIKNITTPASNYSEAIDINHYNPLFQLKNLANKLGFEKTGLSNCILTLSQMYDPSKPIATNRTIVSDPERSGFQEIPEKYAGLGSLVIASLPDKIDGKDNKYHAMMITGYADQDYNYSMKGNSYKVKKGDPLVTYSKGKNSAENLRRNIPLKAYSDNSDGKTYNRYYNHLDENNKPMILLPEVVVTP